MTKKAETLSYSGTIRAIEQDSLYIYAGGATTLTVRKYLKSNMAYVMETANYGGVVYAI